MPWIGPIRKLYHDWRGRPSPNKDGGKLCIGGWIVSISDNNGGPFDGGGKRPPRGGNNDPLERGSNEPLGDQNPRWYVIRLPSPWIGLTWNLWYPSWYLVQPPIAPNPPPSRKSLPYPFTLWERIQCSCTYFSQGHSGQWRKKWF